MTLTELFPRRYIPVPESGCWLWTGGTDRDGYGLISVNGKTDRAHRVSMMIYRNINPAKRQVLHRCDVPSCVNPDHLYLGTSFDNQVDSFSRARNSSAKVSHENVRAIRASQLPTVDLANTYAVSEWTIRRIRRASTYRYVKL